MCHTLMWLVEGSCDQCCHWLSCEILVTSSPLLILYIPLHLLLLKVRWWYISSRIDDQVLVIRLLLAIALPLTSANNGGFNDSCCVESSDSGDFLLSLCTLFILSDLAIELLPREWSTVRWKNQTMSNQLNCLWFMIVSEDNDSKFLVFFYPPNYFILVIIVFKQSPLKRLWLSLFFLSVFVGRGRCIAIPSLMKPWLRAWSGVSLSSGSQLQTVS